MPGATSSSSPGAVSPAERSPFRPAPAAGHGSRRARPDGAASAARSIDEAAALRLDDAVSRLDPASVRDAPLALEALARALGPGEHVEHVVQGWAKGRPCVVARTDRRVVVVLDRFPEPVVESLDRRSTQMSVYGPPGTDRVSLAVVDRRRLLEVTGVRDAAAADALATDTRPGPARRGGRRSREPGYF